jgi:hypothetical protein
MFAAVCLYAWKYNGIISGDYVLLCLACWAAMPSIVEAGVEEQVAACSEFH